MACIYFQPQAIALMPLHPSARLPLIQEYDGVCRAAAEPFAVPVEHRFACCNHGYAHGRCAHFPSAETRSSFRYAVLGRTPVSLEIVCVEEQAYTPVRWHSIRYSPEADVFDPDLADTCMRAQVRAFCRSYLAQVARAS